MTQIEEIHFKTDIYILDKMETKPVQLKIPQPIVELQVNVVITTGVVLL